MAYPCGPGVWDEQLHEARTMEGMAPGCPAPQLRGVICEVGQ